MNAFVLATRILTPAPGHTQWLTSPCWGVLVRIQRLYPHPITQTKRDGKTNAIQLYLYNCYNQILSLSALQKPAGTECT